MVDLRTYQRFVDILVEEIEASDELMHYGVKGMKWGVRKDRSGGTPKVKKTGPELVGLGPSRVEAKTKYGETIVMTKNPPTRLQHFFNRIDKSYYGKNYNDNAHLTITDKAGKRIGDASVSKVSDDELNLVWLGVDKGQRGKGYATAAMQTAEKFGREAGFKKLTLEVPGNSPDARHIYEKLGFKVTLEATDTKDSVWGGLTEMEYVFDSKLKQAEDLVDSLAHYGIKGMKWGRRRAEGANGRVISGDAAQATALKEKAKKSGLASLSNSEVRALNDRLNLEQNYARLNPTTSNFKKAQGIVNQAFSAGNTINQAYGFLNSPAGKLLKEQLKAK